MALLIECPNCRKRNRVNKNHCGCAHNIKKASHKSYWIEYYYNGKGKREEDRALHT